MMKICILYAHCISSPHRHSMSTIKIIILFPPIQKEQVQQLSMRMLINKDKNVHRFALSAIRGEVLEREREKESDREREREIVLGYYTRVTYYL